MNSLEPNHAQLIQEIIERLRQGSPAQFTANELADWPSPVKEALEHANLLQPAAHADVIECQGCEEHCFMEVHVFPKEDECLARAFIACDKRDDIGRVPVGFSQLLRWQISTKKLAQALATLLGMPALAVNKIDDERWHLGILKGKKQHHKSSLLLSISNDIILSVAGHNISLFDVLSINHNQLTLEKEELIHRVDHPIGSEETPAERRERLRARITEKKKQGVKAFLKETAAEEGIDVSRVKQIINWKPPKPKSEQTHSKDSRTKKVYNSEKMPIKPRHSILFDDLDDFGDESDSQSFFS